MPSHPTLMVRAPRGLVKSAVGPNALPGPDKAERGVPRWDAPFQEDYALFTVPQLFLDDHEGILARSHLNIEQDLVFDGLTLHGGFERGDVFHLLLAGHEDHHAAS